MSTTGLSGFLAARSSTAVALRYGEQTLSYDELEQFSKRAASALQALGVGPGDRVALWLPNTPAWLILYFACARLGAISVAVNTRFRSVEVADIISRSGAKVLALWPDFKHIDFTGILAGIDAAKLNKLQTIIVYREDEDNPELPAVLPDRRCLPFHQLLDAPPISTEPGNANSGCNIFTTSGTTSAPKFVLHKQSVIVQHAEDVATSFDFHQAGASSLLVMPLCGVFGFCQALATLAAVRPLTLVTTFDVSETTHLIDAYRITHLYGSDDMLHRLLTLATAGQRLFPSLQVFGVARFNPALDDIIERAASHGICAVGLYGMSEVQALFSHQPLNAELSRRKLAGGVPVSPDTEVRACLGQTGSDGSFIFKTRMGDVLRLGGFLINPQEIEEFISRHETIADCQVVSVEDSAGAKPVAFVILQPGQRFDETALIDYCQAGLAKFKVPLRIFALDEFPTTKSANGTKIQRARLREMAQHNIMGSVNGSIHG